jgi:hypothetical protein
MEHLKPLTLKKLLLLAWRSLYFQGLDSDALILTKQSNFVVFLEKLIVTEPIKKFPVFEELESSLPCSKKSSI